MQVNAGQEGGDSVQVAVRMRVFNGREKSANSKRCVRMESHESGGKTILIDESGQEKAFNYDYCFQSYSQTEQGIGTYATQDTVMHALGIPVLDTALEGRNVSLFAYGQTGAGKSFSMLGKIGVPELEGIIPRTCREIFRRIESEENPLVSYRVDVQVIEIYCEQVNDLLQDRKYWKQGGHKPKLTNQGYVVETTNKPCTTAEQIFTAMQYADKNRSVGSHALNPESSRAHTIYTINIQTIVKAETGKIKETTTCRLNLIDLAGSERTESAGTTGQMLKEGTAINLSLVALGNCIKNLAENKRPNFRDSKLTLLLQSSMTNGKVVMIAAVSPADLCYAETLSTLRFADRIKEVRIKSTKNVVFDPVADLKNQMEALKKKMQAEIDDLIRANARKLIVPGSEEEKQAIAALEQAMQDQIEQEITMKDDLLKQIKELEASTTDRLATAASIEQQWKQDNVVGGLDDSDKVREGPHFVNLDADDRLAEILAYAVPEGEHKIGRSNPADPPTIEFNGLGMTQNHCSIENDGAGNVYITPLNNGRVCVNGKKIRAKTEIFHLSRVWLGLNYALKFLHPKYEHKGAPPAGVPNYDFAQQELMNPEQERLNAKIGLRSLDYHIAECIKKVEQANTIARDLGREVTFEPKMCQHRISHAPAVFVLVSYPDGLQLIWIWEKFNGRLFKMIQMWQQVNDLSNEASSSNMDEVAEDTDDPYIDTEPQLLGESDIWLQCLSNMIDMNIESNILSISGRVEGLMSVSMLPCDKNGSCGPWDDDCDLDPFVDEPTDLLNTTISFQVNVNSIKWKHKSIDQFESLFVRYQISPYAADTWCSIPWHTSPEIQETTYQTEMKLDWCTAHQLFVSDDALCYLKDGKLTVQVWGTLRKNSKRPFSSNSLTARKKELQIIDRAVHSRLAICNCPSCQRDVSLPLEVISS